MNAPKMTPFMKVDTHSDFLFFFLPKIFKMKKHADIGMVLRGKNMELGNNGLNTGLS